MTDSKESCKKDIVETKNVVNLQNISTVTRTMTSQNQTPRLMMAQACQTTSIAVISGAPGSSASHINIPTINTQTQAQIIPKVAATVTPIARVSALPLPTAGPPSHIPRGAAAVAKIAAPVKSSMTTALVRQQPNTQLSTIGVTQTQNIAGSTMRPVSVSPWMISTDTLLNMAKRSGIQVPTISNTLPPAAHNIRPAQNQNKTQATARIAVINPLKSDVRPVLLQTVTTHKPMSLCQAQHIQMTSSNDKHKSFTILPSTNQNVNVRASTSAGSGTQNISQNTATLNLAVQPVSGGITASITPTSTLPRITTSLSQSVVYKPVFVSSGQKSVSLPHNKAHIQTVQMSVPVSSVQQNISPRQVIIAGAGNMLDRAGTVVRALPPTKCIPQSQVSICEHQSVIHKSQARVNVVNTSLNSSGYAIFQTGDSCIYENKDSQLSGRSLPKDSKDIKKTITGTSTSTTISIPQVPSPTPVRFPVIVQTVAESGKILPSSQNTEYNNSAMNSENSNIINLTQSPLKQNSQRPTILRKRETESNLNNTPSKKFAASSPPPSPRTPPRNDSVANMITEQRFSQYFNRNLSPAKLSSHASSTSSTSSTASAGSPQDESCNIMDNPPVLSEEVHTTSTLNKDATPPPNRPPHPPPALSAVPVPSPITSSPGGEFSPRKKPRKQQLNSKHVNLRRGSTQDIEFVEQRIPYKLPLDQMDESTEYEYVTRSQSHHHSHNNHHHHQRDRERDYSNYNNREDINRRKSPEHQHRLSLLSCYKSTWKSRMNHFEKKSDIRVKDTGKLTLTEIANQKNIMDKTSYWKIQLLTGNLDDVRERCDIYVKKFSLLLELAQHESKKKDMDKELLSAYCRLNDLSKGCIHKCRQLSKLMDNCKSSLFKLVQMHQSQAIKLLTKCMNKRATKKRSL